MTETITLQPKITYKRRRNSRAFKMWDSAIIGSIMTGVAEIKQKIIEEAEKQDKMISELNHTAVPTETLYLILDSYLDMYKKLMNESLIQTANHKTHPNLH